MMKLLVRIPPQDGPYAMLYLYDDGRLEPFIGTGIWDFITFIRVFCRHKETVRAQWQNYIYEVNPRCTRQEMFELFLSHAGETVIQ